MTALRLDKALVERGLLQSRARAVRLITHAGVEVNGMIVTDPSKVIPQDAVIVLLQEDIPWVSRAGLKLEHALRTWSINVAGNTCLDIGASTGGFTQVLLAHQAKQVFAIDVGHGQLAEELKGDSRVITREGVHILETGKADFESPIDTIVVDVSFISLSKILPKIAELLRPAGKLIALIKPQFEFDAYVGKQTLADPVVHEKIILRISEVAQSLGFTIHGVLRSPIEGGDGNIEYLLFATK